MTKMHVRNITGLPAVLDKFDDFARQTVVRAMAEVGITVVAGSFEKGAVVTSTNEGVYQESTGKVYSWFTDATITVPAGSTPASSGGIGAGAWVDRTQETLRGDLLSVGGSYNVDGGYLLVAPLLPSKTTDLHSAISAILSSSVSGSAYPVNLRNGTYLSDGIVVPANSSLIGVDVTRAGMPGNWINGDSDDLHGTTVWTEDTVNPMFDMRVGSQVKNINIWQRGQTVVDDPNTIIPFAPVFSITNDGAGGNSDNVTVKNVSSLNCYDFMKIGDGINPVGRTIVEDVFANPLHEGIVIRSKDGDLPMLNRVFLENLFTTTPVYMPNLHNYIKENSTAFTIDAAQGVNMTDCIALSYGIGLKIQGTQAWAQIENFLADQCSLPLLVSSCDKVQINNFNFAQNYKPFGPSVRVVGNIVKQLSLSNGWIGDYYTNIKTGIFSTHTSGVVSLSNVKFGTSFPAVLNTAEGAVELSVCGFDYNRVVGKNISIDGGPALAAGGTLGLANINPTSPAASGWSYTTPANVTAITNGIRISGAGNNTIEYRPGSISAEENNKITWGSHIYCMEFDFKVTGQAGSPRMEIAVLSDAGDSLVDCFQLCSDEYTANSALPEGETYHIALILPWHVLATRLRFSLPSQTGQVIEITNLDIKQVGMQKGFSGLEWFNWATRLPTGRFNPHTGKRIMQYVDHPPAGSWEIGDEWEWWNGQTPVTGNKIGGVYTGSGWLSKGVFS